MTKLSQAEEEAISKLLDKTEELIRLNKFDEAETFLNEIAKHKPHEINLPLQRGALFAKKGEHDKALEQFLAAYKKLPAHFQCINNIAASYFKLNKYKDAISFYQKALAIQPDADFILAAIGWCLFRQGNLDEAMEYIEKALEISPTLPHAHSGLLLAMIYAESVSPEQLTEKAKRFGKIVAEIFPPRTDFANEKNKNRKLRIGYVSPDFRDHPVPYFLDPLLRNHDRTQFEIYAYSNTPYQNPVMEHMKTHVDHWRDIYDLKEKEVSDIIVNDCIDILVDVTGHTAHNSLTVFAGRAAPVQASWLGYPATTGVQTMDYRITDVNAEPVGMTEHLSTETLWRLPHIFCAYSAHENSPAVIDHPPCEDNGYITFGCFNNFVKVRDSVLKVWSEIISQVPNSKLLLEMEGLDDYKFLKQVQKRLKQQNIPLDRVILMQRKRSNQFLLYNKVDLALDPFPCNGGTTSFDTLWMGVPFITLAGDHFAARMGVTILSNAGLPELIASDTDAYIKMAVDLVKDKERLKKIRHNLREKFAKSPAMDQKAFARDMEEAYRGMWNKYCDSN